MRLVLTKPDESDAASRPPARITDLTSTDPTWIAAAVRIEVRRRLRAWHSRRLGEMDEKDLVQHVLLALFDKDRAALKRFDPELGEAIPYLRDFAQKRLLELERKLLRRENLLKPRVDPKTATKSSLDTPEKWIECFEQQSELMRYLKEHASPEDLDIFYLSVVKDLPNPEVARIKNVSVEHVSNRKYALRKHARTYFDRLQQEGGSNR